MKLLTSALRQSLRFASRRPGEAVLAARMGACVAALSVMIRVMPLPRVLKLLSTAPRRPRGIGSGPSGERIAQLLDAVLNLNVLCFRPVCWKRAAVLHRYLALHGRETRICFGLRREGGDMLAGHAWLEDGGVPLFEASHPEYSVTYSFPS